eukprot:c13424_g1_i1.p1 GENE.c13424_g1_i1~~c13424_g1_i1.p1  ORF type:complete len:123 (+),score=33.87 c13424_g1_i1:203-571(+)
MNKMTMLVALAVICCALVLGNPKEIESELAKVVEKDSINYYDRDGNFVYSEEIASETESSDDHEDHGDNGHGNDGHNKGLIQDDLTSSSSSNSDSSKTSLLFSKFNIGALIPRIKELLGRTA